MKLPILLLEENSPRCPITAIVEQDKRTVYFYLISNNKELSFGVKSCWVRNLKKAPKSADLKSLKKGFPPLLSADFCKFPKGQNKLSPENLKIVWFEEGDGAALLENDSILAIIPSWSGYQGFHGYSRDCIGESSLSWEIGNKNQEELLNKVKKNIEIWKKWENDNHWINFQNKSIELLESEFGKYDKYFAIDGGVWPPKALITFRKKSNIILSTIGVSLSPQPSVENSDLDRIELGMILDESFTDEEIKYFASVISFLAQYPWNDITWIGDGHTIAYDFSKIESISNFQNILLVEKFEKSPKIDFSSIYNKKTQMLWLIPITELEKDYAIQNQSSKLKEKLITAGVNIKVQSRECIFNKI